MHRDFDVTCNCVARKSSTDGVITVAAPLANEIVQLTLKLIEILVTRLNSCSLSLRKFGFHLSQISPPLMVLSVGWPCNSGLRLYRSLRNAARIKWLPFRLLKQELRLCTPFTTALNALRGACATASAGP